MRYHASTPCHRGAGASDEGGRSWPRVSNAAPKRRRSRRPSGTRRRKAGRRRRSSRPDRPCPARDWASTAPPRARRVEARGNETSRAARGRPRGAVRARLAAVALVLAAAGAASAEEALPELVTFPSADGRTTLIGYLFAPA